MTSKLIKKKFTSKRQHFHFKNGIFEGGLVQSKREGLGIALFDEGIATICEYQNDKLHGKGLSFIPGIGIIGGEYLRGCAIGALVGMIGESQSKLIIDTKDGKKKRAFVILQQNIVMEIEEGQEGEFKIKEGNINEIEKYAQRLKEMDDLQILSNYPDIQVDLNKQGNKQISFKLADIKSLNGLAIIIDAHNLSIEQGEYQDNKLEGLGRVRTNNGDYIEAVYKGGEIKGKWFLTNGNLGKDQIFIQKRKNSPTKKDENIQEKEHKKFQQIQHERSANYFSTFINTKELVPCEVTFLRRIKDYLQTQIVPLQQPINAQLNPAHMMSMDKYQSNSIPFNSNQVPFNSNQMPLNSKQISNEDPQSPIFNEQVQGQPILLETSLHPQQLISQQQTTQYQYQLFSSPNREGEEHNNDRHNKQRQEQFANFSDYKQHFTQKDKLIQNKPSLHELATNSHHRKAEDSLSRNSKGFSEIKTHSTFKTQNTLPDRFGSNDLRISLRSQKYFHRFFQDQNSKSLHQQSQQNYLQGKYSMHSKSQEKTKLMQRENNHTQIQKMPLTPGATKKESNKLAKPKSDSRSASLDDVQAQKKDNIPFKYSMPQKRRSPIKFELKKNLSLPRPNSRKDEKKMSAFIKQKQSLNVSSSAQAKNSDTTLNLPQQSLLQKSEEKDQQKASHTKLPDSSIAEKIDQKMIKTEGNVSINNKDHSNTTKSELNLEIDHYSNQIKYHHSSRKASQGYEEYLKTNPGEPSILPVCIQNKEEVEENTFTFHNGNSMQESNLHNNYFDSDSQRTPILIQQQYQKQQQDQSQQLLFDNQRWNQLQPTIPLNTVSTIQQSQKSPQQTSLPLNDNYIKYQEYQQQQQLQQPQQQLPFQLKHEFHQQLPSQLQQQSPYYQPQQQLSYSQQQYQQPSQQYQNIQNQNYNNIVQQLPESRQQQQQQIVPVIAVQQMQVSSTLKPDEPDLLQQTRMINPLYAKNNSIYNHYPLNYLNNKNDTEIQYNLGSYQPLRTIQQESNNNNNINSMVLQPSQVNMPQSFLSSYQNESSLHYLSKISNPLGFHQPSYPPPALHY